MSTVIISFLIGVLTASTVGYVTTRKLAIERRQHLNALAGRDAQIENFKLDKAYQDGRNYEANMHIGEMDGLNARIYQLQDENDQLRQQLGTETIFANSLAKGGTAVRLQMRRREVAE